MNTTPERKLLIHLFSDANFLATNILENLLSKNCFVNIITDDEKGWIEKTLHISHKARFSILRKKDFIPKQTIDYAIFCQGFLKKREAYQNLALFNKLNLLTTGKTILLIPFEPFSLKESASLKLNSNSSIIYVGDLLGPRMDFDSNLLLPKTLGEALTKKSMTIPVGEIFYPVFVPDVAKTICKWLLSFGPFGQELFLIGGEVSASDFWKINDSLISGIKLKFTEGIPARTLPKNYEIKTLNSNLRFCLSETYSYMASGGHRISVPEIKIEKQISRRPILLIVIAAFVLFFPLLTLLSGTGLLLAASRQFLSGGDGGFQNIVLLAKTTFIIGKGESTFLEYIPIFGRAYKETRFMSEVGEKLSEISLVSLPAARSSSELFGKVLGNEIYDPQAYADQIKQGLSYLYQGTSVLEAETKGGIQDGLIAADWFSRKVNFEKIKNISREGGVLAENLPEILGKGDKKAYLILFENNMELRPTGGFIGSYGVASFDSGRMIELNINDVYSADGQLRGHVEPPGPIKNYLGEANWWLRDSNWDPDFPTSAQRAEWFLDKETDTQVDGVFAIDLSLVKDLLRYTGPIFLPDYNLDITSENLYERTQEEVQDNFFPGSRKKGSFLTALSRSLIVKLAEFGGKEKFQAIAAIFNNFEGRHVQAYFHNDLVQSATLNMGWSGQISTPECGERCYADLLGITEANLGVNKANYFISRDVSVSVNYSPAKITRTISLNLKNSANTALGPTGKYKVYVRFLVPADSEILGFRSVVGESQQNITPEVVENKGKKEIGTLTEVLGGQNEKIEMTWQSTPSGVENYALYVRKQAGVDNYPFSLTVNGASVYNTTLVKDIWTKKF